MPTRGRAAGVAAWLAAGAGLAGAQLALGWPCPLREGVGLDCPLCGATRSVLALADGRVVDAVDLNLAVPAAVLLVPVALGLLAVRWRAGRGTPWRLPDAAFRRAMVLAIAWMVLRNLPMLAILRSGR